MRRTTHAHAMGNGHFNRWEQRMLLALALLQGHFVGWWNTKMRAFLRPVAAKMWRSTQQGSVGCPFTPDAGFLVNHWSWQWRTLSPLDLQLPRLGRSYRCGKGKGSKEGGLPQAWDRTTNLAKPANPQSHCHTILFQAFSRKQGDPWSFPALAFSWCALEGEGLLF